jgi:hypothetical protein
MVNESLFEIRNDNGIISEVNTTGQAAHLLKLQQ